MKHKFLSLVQYIEQPELLTNKTQVINYLKFIIDNNLVHSAYNVIDYKYLFAVEQYYKNDYDVLLLLNAVKDECVQTYLLDSQLIKHLL